MKRSQNSNDSAKKKRQRRTAQEQQFEDSLFGMSPLIKNDFRSVFQNDAQVTRLFLNHSNLRDAGALVLAEALKTNNIMHSLNLGNNAISSVGATAIFRTLKNKKNVTYINLTKNDIDCSGAIAFAELMVTNNWVTIADLSSNKIRKPGADAIAKSLLTNTGLISLDLKANGFNLQTACEFVFMLRFNCTLKVLDLWNDWDQFNGTELKELKNIAETLKVNVTLNTFKFGFSFLTDANARVLIDAIQNNSTLTNVSFMENIVNVQRITALRTIETRNTNFKKNLNAITKPLYECDNSGTPTWKINPDEKAMTLYGEIEKFQKADPAFKNSKLLQELYGLALLCSALYFIQKGFLDEAIVSLRKAEMMGYHYILTHETAMGFIVNTANAQQRIYLDAQLPGRDAPVRVERRAKEPPQNLYAYNRFKLSQASNGPKPTEAQLLKAAEPLKRVGLRL